MTTTLKVTGHFRVKPGRVAAFAELVEALEALEALGVDDYNFIELGDNDTIVLSIDEDVSNGTYNDAMTLLGAFVVEHSVLGAAVLQTGDSPADWSYFGPDVVSTDKDSAYGQARRGYFTGHRDFWQQQLDNLDPK